MTIALRFEDVHWRPPGAQRPVVDGVTLHLEAGEVVALLGPSGCGKTSLLRLAAGLTVPDRGTVSGPGGSPRPQACLMFQQHALFPHLSVAENVAFGLATARIDTATRNTIVADALGAVGLSGFDERRPDELSGGQQQRVALARALVVEPAVLLLDEPLSNVDAGLRRSLREDLRELQRRHGWAVLWVTHDHTEALAVSDRLVVMNQGRIVQQGATQEVCRAPRDAFVAGFLGDGRVLQARWQAHPRTNAAGARPGVWLVGGWPLPAELTDAWPEAVDQTVAIRPEAWRIGRPDTTGLPGRVLGHAYLGRYTEYWVSTPLGVVLVVAYSTARAHETGAPVSLRLTLQGVSRLTGGPG